MPILTLLTFVPLAGCVVVLAIPRSNVFLIKCLGLVFTFVAFVLSIIVTLRFDPTVSGFQFQEKLVWIPQLNVYYHLGVDGLSVPLIFLTGLITFLSAIASWNLEKRTKEYWVLYLLHATGMMGTFTTLDLFFFYIFWELTLVPMYFLIGIWGGARRQYASFKFFLYTLSGSVLMLASFLAFYFTSNPHTFSIPELYQLGQKGTLFAGETARMFGMTIPHVVFIGLFIGFAIKVSAWPFHTWLPDVYVEAPTAISVLLAAVLLKMGGYGFYRISHPILPQAAKDFAWLFVWMGVIGIIYGAFVAMAQTDFKKMVAYSSVSHMGFVLFGLSAFTVQGFVGGYFQMFSHGILTGAMFLLVGVLYERAGTRDLNSFGGLMFKMPKYAIILIIISLGSWGLPGLSGFMGELITFMGTLPVYRTFTIVSALAIVLTAGYILYLMQRLLLGPFNEKWANITDINLRELITVVPLVVITIILGIYPTILLNMISPYMRTLITSILGATH